jgi:hypothetical protein
MDFEDFLPEYPSTDDPALQQRLLNKKEFFDFRIRTLTRETLETPAHDDLQRHQRLIQRFLSPKTLYDELLLYHETGTGKTRAAFAATEQVLLNQTPDFRKVFFLTSGPDLGRNAKRELIAYARTVSRFQNVVEDDRMSLDEYIKKELRGVYEFQTWNTFTDNTSRLEDVILFDQFNNCIFIVDEVHNLPEGSNAYRHLFRLFNLLTNRKILLMSGTPMRDRVDQIAGIMNLILPLEQQLPTGTAFSQTFVDTEARTLRDTDRLMEAFRGRVSYLRATPDLGVQPTYMGEILDPELPIDQFRYFPTQMSALQLQGYQQAYPTTNGEEQVQSDDHASNFYNDARQATLFVFPDGSCGKAGMAYFKTLPQSTWREMVNPPENLRQYSSKYAYVLQQLNRPEEQNQLTFVYCSLVDGSGLELFAKILEAYGFSRCRGNESTPGKRYMLLTSSAKQSKQQSKQLRPQESDAEKAIRDMTKLIHYFNQDRNRNGEYCRVILGSRIASEGFTFKNVRNIHILTLHWNYTETLQAIARAIRFGSHRSLMDHPAQIIPVRIYQHACLTDPLPSIDLQMLRVAQEKDVLIRRMTRFIKEISFDCPLVYVRNYVADGTPRDCDYEACDYTCAQTETADNQPTQDDLTTYRLYYQEGSDADVRMAIRRYFQQSTGLPVDLYAIQDYLQVDWFQLVRVLSELIRFNTPLVNAYGIECYLREDHNQYYLVDNILLPNEQQSLGWYTHHPAIVETFSLKTLLRRKGFKIYSERIDELCNSDTADVLNSLPGRLQELYRSQQQKQRQEGLLTEQEVFQLARSQGVSYYGTLDQRNDFRIVDIRGADETADVRKLKSGSVCLGPGYNKDRLVQVYFSLGADSVIEIPDSLLERYPDPLAAVEREKYGPKLLEDPELGLEYMGTEVYTRSLYVILQLLAMNKVDLCNTLQEWMRSHGLLALILSDVKGVRKSKLKGIRK